MLAGGQRYCRLGVTHLRRRADRHCIDGGPSRNNSIQRRRMRHARQRGVGVGDRDQFHALGRRNGRHMLVARDLAEADDGDAKRIYHHSLDPVIIIVAAP